MSKLRATPYWGGLLFFLFLIILLSGCAIAPQTAHLLNKPAELPSSHELVKTAFYPQEKYQCGPAALATVLNDAGINITPAELVPEIYIPARQGSLQIEILASSRRHGRIAYRIEPNMETLFKEVAAGNPVLVMQNLGLSWLPTWHYAVVVGFDLKEEKIILRSGLEERHLSPLSTFEHTWARSNYWGIVVLPPDRLPETANAQGYLKAVVALEHVKRWKEVQTAYSTALNRWPTNLVAQMGLGNSHYMLKNLSAAEQTFRAAIKHHPDSGPAHNNLAQVLMEQGKITEAKTHAMHATELGGPQLDNFRATLMEINREINRGINQQQYLKQ